MSLAGKYQSSGHEPVLSGPVIAYLAKDRSGRYLDATFGGGGHTQAILEADAENHIPHEFRGNWQPFRGRIYRNPI